MKLAYDLFHNVIYNYTHHNLKKLMKDEAVTLLLRGFLQPATFNGFAARDSTLAAHGLMYKTAAEAMRMSIDEE